MSPADACRMHALQAIALYAGTQAAERPPNASTSPHDRAYLASYAATCDAIAARCRASPGYTLTDAAA